MKGSSLMRSGVVVLLLLMTIRGYSQIRRYPVSGGMQVLSSYPYLYQYADLSGRGLLLQLTLNDITIPSRQIKLKMKIKGGGIEAYSKELLYTEPYIVLQGGATSMLTSDQLAYYFKEENLEGLSSEQYNHILREDRYTFSFVVYDAQTDKQLSDEIVVPLFVTLTQEPLLIAPGNNYNVKAASNEYSSVLFQWTIASQASEYEFTLIELDEGQDIVPQLEAAALSAMPASGIVCKVVTPSASLLYNPGQSYYTGPLLAGKRYGWRVRALYKPDGINVLNIYKNDGYSMPWAFVYQGNCADMTDFQTESKSSNQINVSWPASMQHSAYQLSYRKQSGEQEWPWQQEQTPDTHLNLTQLEADTKYEIKLAGVCAGINNATAIISDGPVKVVQTLAEGIVQGIECGKEPQIDLSNQVLKEAVAANDIVLAGDFPITLSEVNGSKQGWNGKAWVGVPLIGGTRWELRFDKAVINEKGRLIDGFFQTTYDPNMKNIADVTDQVDQLLQDMQDAWNEAVDSKDMDKIDELIEALLEDNALPTELKDEVDLARTDVQTALVELRAATEKYNQLPDEPEDEKAAAKEAMEKAEEKYKQAKEAMVTAVDQLKDFLTEFKDLFQSAVKEIGEENESSFDKTKKELEEVIPGLKQDTKNDVSDITAAMGAKPADNAFFKEIFKTHPLANTTANSPSLSLEEMAARINKYDKNIIAQRLRNLYSTPEGKNKLLERLKKGIAIDSKEKAESSNKVTNYQELVDLVYQLTQQGKETEEKIGQIKAYIYNVVGDILENNVYEGKEDDTL